MEKSFDPGELEIFNWSGKSHSGFSLSSENGVKIIHLPTGLVVTCEKNKSQHKNKHDALLLLKEKLEKRDHESLLGLKGLSESIYALAQFKER